MTILNIKPNIFSEEEISKILSNISDEEKEKAFQHSMVILEDTIFYEGEAGGSIVTDIEGNKYIDCTAQYWTLNIGYSHPDVVYAAFLQAMRLNHVDYLTPTIPRLKLINKLGEIFPLKKVVLNVQGGGWSNETAFKIAMANKPDADLFMVAWRGYHGNSLAMTAASHPLSGLARYRPFGLSRFIRFPYPDCYRCPYKMNYPDCGIHCLDHVEETILNSSWGKIAGILIEPIQGPGGMIPAPREFLKGLKELAEKYDIYLIFDEAQTAFGRVGAWSASHLYNITPDIMTLTKALGGGFPVGATLAREDMQSLSYADERTTFGGNPFIYAAALINIMVIEKLNLIDTAREKGKYASKRLNEIKDNYEIVGDIRGPGLFIGIDIVRDKDDREPAPDIATEIIEKSKEKGVLFGQDMPTIYSGIFTRMNVIKFKPPLVITYEEIDKALDTLEESLREVSERYGISYTKR